MRHSFYPNLDRNPPICNKTVNKSPKQWFNTGLIKNLMLCYKNCCCKAPCEWNFEKLVRSGKSSIRRRECNQPNIPKIRCFFGQLKNSKIVNKNWKKSNKTLTQSPTKCANEINVMLNKKSWKFQKIPKSWKCQKIRKSQKFQKSWKSQKF